MANFDPALSAALDAVTTQRNRTNAILNDVAMRLRASQNDPLHRRHPQPPGECGQALVPHGIRDMKAVFNRVLDAIRDGSATDDSVRGWSKTSVVIANSLLEPASVCLDLHITPLDESSITAGWLHILSSFNGMDDHDRKELSKHLDKNVRW